MLRLKPVATALRFVPASQLQCHTNVVPVFEELDPQPAFFRPSPSPSTASGLAGIATAALTVDAAPNGGTAAAAAGDGAAAIGAAAPSAAVGADAATVVQELHYTPPPLCSAAGQRGLKSEKLEGMRRVVVMAVAVTGLLYSCVGA